MDAPGDLLYSQDHEWVRDTKDGLVTVGITDFAQDALGEVVYVGLPDTGVSVVTKAQIAEVESTKSVSDVHSPVSGEVVAVNTELIANPKILNTDPYGDGWLFTIKLTNPEELATLLEAKAYLDSTGAGL